MNVPKPEKPMYRQPSSTVRPVVAVPSPDSFVHLPSDTLSQPPIVQQALFPVPTLPAVAFGWPFEFAQRLPVFSFRKYPFVDKQSPPFVD